MTTVRILASASSHPHHIQAAWALTGATWNWNAPNSVFSGLKPAQPLNFSGGRWGALERAARYGLAGLNNREDLLPAAGGILGSEQEARRAKTWKTFRSHAIHVLTPAVC